MYQIFYATMDRKLIILSAVFSAICVFGSIVCFWVAYVDRKKPRLVRVSLGCLGVFLVGLVLYSAATSPREYRLGDDNLVISGWLRETVVPLSGPVYVAEVDSAWMRRSQRIFGNGGLFSYSGTFRHRDVGNFQMAAVRSTNPILVQTESRTVVISPNDPAGFVAAVKSRFPDKELVRRLK